MKKLMLAMAVMATLVVPMTSAQAAPCTNSTVIATSGTNNCSITLDVSVPLAASLTFSAVPTSFGSVLPGTISSAQNISYAVDSNGGTTKVAVTGSGSNPEVFEFKPHVGSFDAVPTGGTLEVNYVGAQTGLARTDQVRANVPAGTAAGAKSYTLLYTVTIS